MHKLCSKRMRLCNIYRILCNMGKGSCNVCMPLIVCSNPLPAVCTSTLQRSRGSHRLTQDSSKKLPRWAFSSMLWFIESVDGMASITYRYGFLFLPDSHVTTTSHQFTLSPQYLFLLTHPLPSPLHPLPFPSLTPPPILTPPPHCPSPLAAVCLHA